MNVGDYIRIDGYISKIGHVKKSSSGKIYAQWKQPNGLLASANIKLIEKSSPQIIDLIEAGDYVNGNCVIEAAPKDKRKKQIIIVDSTCVEYGDLPLDNKDIKTIVTHEQMEAMQYRVEK